MAVTDEGVTVSFVKTTKELRRRKGRQIELLLLIAQSFSENGDTKEAPNPNKMTPAKKKKKLRKKKERVRIVFKFDRGN